MYDPIEMAHKSPYFKRNHVGKVVCTLCNIYCNDEMTFMRHLSGKTHTQQVENKERRERRRHRLEEEERLDQETRAREEQERMTQKLAGATASSLTSSGVALVTGRFGEPEYRFRTEHHPTLFETKVWLDFMFPFAEDGTRPLHRWLSAREQRVEAPPDAYFVYLLVACEGYTTVAVKFPAEPKRTTSESPMMTSWASTIPATATTTTTAAAKNEEEEAEVKPETAAPDEEGEDKDVTAAPAVSQALAPSASSASAAASRPESAMESPYVVSWDPTRRVYHLYFIMSR